MAVKVEYRNEVKRCYQSAKQLLKENSSEHCTEISLPRTDFSCLASTVLSELGETAAVLRECLKSAAGDKVKVPRDAVMQLMKSVANWISISLRESAQQVAAPVPASESDQRPAAGPVRGVANWTGRVLIVGAGATGACSALRLRSALGDTAKIVVWEKARGAGGRMSTNRQDSINVRADMGAPYLSLDGQDPECSAVANMLVKAQVCADVPHEQLSRTPERPSSSAWRHLAGVNGGVNDALKKLFEEANADLLFEQRLTTLDQQADKWRAKPFSGSAQEFDAVIVAVPGCGRGGDNLDKIHGQWERAITREQSQQLQGVQHDQRWAFALFFPTHCAAKCDRFFGAKAVEKVVDDGVVHLLCYQTRKVSQVGGPNPGGGIAVVAHTTVEWARKNSSANGRDQRLLNEVSEQVKWILGLGRTRPLASKVITWKQSQVSRAIPGSDRNACMLLSSSPPLLLAGDYFTESNFGGCLKSAYAAADALANVLMKGSVGSNGAKRRIECNGSNDSKKSRIAV